MSAKPPYFADKKVLITGASSGVGMALAYWYIASYLFMYIGI
jgi:short-subunit dehydrogenase